MTFSRLAVLKLKSRNDNRAARKVATVALSKGNLEDGQEGEGRLPDL